MLSQIYFNQNGPVAVSRDNPLPVVMGGFTSDYNFNSSMLLDNATNPVLVKSLTAGKSIYITDITISAQQAGWLELQDSDGTVVMDRFFLAANGNVAKSFNTAKKVTASKALMAKTSASIKVSLNVDGYIA